MAEFLVFTILSYRQVGMYVYVFINKTEFMVFLSEPETGDIGASFARTPYSTLLKSWDTTVTGVVVVTRNPELFRAYEKLWYSQTAR